MPCKFRGGPEYAPNSHTIEVELHVRKFLIPACGNVMDKGTKPSETLQNVNTLNTK